MLSEAQYIHAQIHTDTHGYTQIHTDAYGHTCMHTCTHRYTQIQYTRCKLVIQILDAPCQSSSCHFALLLQEKRKDQKKGPKEGPHYRYHALLNSFVLRDIKVYYKTTTKFSYLLFFPSSTQHALAVQKPLQLIRQHTQLCRPRVN